VDEAGLLACVHRCRGWVTAPDADVAIASGLERDLDKHIARISSVCARVDPPGQPRTAPTPAAFPPAAVATRVQGTDAVSLLEALSSNEGAGTAHAPAATPTPPPPAAPSRPPGRCTPLWSRASNDSGDYVCEMYTAPEGITVRLVCGERVLAAKGCKNLDEAFSQSTTWKRLPDPESLAAEPRPPLDAAAVPPLPDLTSGVA
jgi:hypothetical protein